MWLAVSHTKTGSFKAKYPSLNIDFKGANIKLQSIVLTKNQFRAEYHNLNRVINRNHNQWVVIFYDPIWEAHLKKVTEERRKFEWKPWSGEYDKVLDAALEATGLPPSEIIDKYEVYQPDLKKWKIGKSEPVPE